MFDKLMKKNGQNDLWQIKLVWSVRRKNNVTQEFRLDGHSVISRQD